MKEHYYCFSFLDSEDDGPVYASEYACFPEPAVNLQNIAAAKVSAGVSPDAILLGCSYLGHMTASEFNG